MKRQKIYGNTQEFIHLNNYLKNVKPELFDFVNYPSKISQERDDEWELISLSKDEIDYIVNYSNDIIILGLMAKNLKIKV